MPGMSKRYDLFQWTPRLVARWPPAEKPQTAAEVLFSSATDQIILRLQAAKRLPTYLPTQFEGLLKLPVIEIAESEIADFAAFDKAVERAQRFFHRRTIVPAMHLIEIEIVDFQTAQAILDASRNVLAAYADFVRPVSH